MTRSNPISVEQEKTIIKTSNYVASTYARSYAEKIGYHNLFTKEDIEDIAANAICKACRSFGSFDSDKGKLTTWVGMIVTNCVKNAAQYKIKRLPISGEMFTYYDEECCNHSVDECCDSKKGFNDNMRSLLSENDAEKEINRKDFEACLRNAVSTLSEKNQHYVHLLEEGESNSTIAELEGCTPNAVAKRIWVIRKTLKGSIKGIAEEFNLPADNLAC